MKIKFAFPLLLIVFFISLVTLVALARNPASESENYQLLAQVLPSLAGQSTSENYDLVSTGGEPLGGGQESVSENFGLRSGFWLGNEATEPPPPVFGNIFLPIVTLNASSFFEGPNELEPNDSSAQANGPLRIGKEYFGLPTDDRDFYSFFTTVQGQIMIDLTNHPLELVNGAQVQLFYQSVIGGAVAIDVAPPYQLVYNGSPGIYYLLVFTDTSKCGNCTVPYTLHVSFSIIE
ncbi:MAG: hypothetical protein HUU38_18860 [Anaerolineales bacterium]|nr:hypothetical protein [Anaerolineales bacterium]